MPPPQAPKERQIGRHHSIFPVLNNRISFYTISIMSQSLSKIWVHIIFSTKMRKNLLKSTEVRSRLYNYLAATSRALKSEIDVIGGYDDHIHILMILPKDMSLSTYVSKLKSSSSKWLKTLTDIDVRLRDFSWQNGYGAFSVSQSSIKAVKHYIQNQANHHKKYDFKEELLRLLKAHIINFDENYLWS